jgi:predicted TIM-barrel fold metal-dependent hydrolase
VHVYGNALLPGGPDDPDYYYGQVEKLYRMGVDGYKMLEGKPAYRRDLGKPLSDSLFEQMYSFIEKKGMPLKIHMCDPRKYWGPKETMAPSAIARGWWYGDGTYPAFDSIWGELETVLDRFPSLKLCAAHFGYISDDIERCLRAFERWKNFSFDFTPGASTFDSFTKNPVRWREFVEKYSDRLYFGTDTYNKFEESPEALLQGIYEETGVRYRLVRAMLEYSPDVKIVHPGFDPFTPIRVSDTALKNIYCDNVDRLLGEGRALDYRLILNEAERVRQEYLEGKHSYIEESEQKLELENLAVIIDYFKGKL